MTWLQEELTTVVQSLPPTRLLEPEENQRLWKSWLYGLKVRFTLPQDLPPLRMLLVMDNLVGHKTSQFVLWLCAHGIMPLYTPLGGSWLNMAAINSTDSQTPSFGGSSSTNSLSNY